MREIKFRAWDGKQMHRVCRLGCNGFSTDVWSPSPVACISAFSKNLEIMQYTGLRDKNGKEIYEGDILLYHPYMNLELLEKTEQDEVIWGETGDSDGWAHEKHFEWVVGKDSLADIYVKAEIIGNIYEKSK